MDLGICLTTSPSCPWRGLTGDDERWVAMQEVGRDFQVVGCKADAKMFVLGDNVSEPSALVKGAADRLSEPPRDAISGLTLIGPVAGTNDAGDGVTEPPRDNDVGSGTVAPIIAA